MTVPAGARKAHVRFTTSLSLRVRDGIQLRLPGLDRPFGFAVRGMRVAARSRRRK